MERTYDVPLGDHTQHLSDLNLSTKILQSIGQDPDLANVSRMLDSLPEDHLCRSRSVGRQGLLAIFHPQSDGLTPQGVGRIIQHTTQHELSRRGIQLL